MDLQVRRGDTTGKTFAAIWPPTCSVTAPPEPNRNNNAAIQSQHSGVTVRLDEHLSYRRDRMISRRDFLGTSLGAGAALALTPELLRAFQQSGGKLIQRAIPSSGEMLPAISFSPRQEADSAAMKEILKTLLDNSGKVVDVLHGGPAGEQAGRAAANELGIQDKFFWTTPVQNAGPGGPGKPPAQTDPAALKAALEEKLATFKKIDLVM